MRFLSAFAQPPWTIQSLWRENHGRELVDARRLSAGEVSATAEMQTGTTGSPLGKAEGCKAAGAP
ncbi:hypothetical protein BU251_03465 [Candidatus Velamenicoccus archaeovorus]|uniref:Uncharacterized protein n=1 Tax=Velamenicoccus archaeovorus TaxID=1930593 RepID=A0A410P3T4_VELA1|nr:hypothetical protein BU251_03465 [Candidatus Velamenicoccus archaeovorus]